MRSSLKYTAVIVPAAAAALFAATGSQGQASQPAFSPPLTIDNPYLPLTTHRRCDYRGTGGARSVLTRLDATKRFDVGDRPVDVAVFRDNAYEDGHLVESTLDYYAQA